MMAACSAAVFPFISAKAGNEAPPNIVFLYTDQQHGFTVSENEDYRFDTPAIDELAGRGVTFSRSFCATPQCSPSRASLMTGQYPHRTGVITNEGHAAGRGIPLNPAIPTIGSIFRERGYDTAYFGKWHLGGNPLSHGWNRYERGGDSELSEKASAYLDSRPRSPFFLFVSYLDPHDIYHVKSAFDDGRDVSGVRLPRSCKDDLAGKPRPQRVFMEEDQGAFIRGKDSTFWKTYRSYYREKVKKVDTEIGRVLQALKRNGLEKNTLIVFTSDHGDMDTAHGLVFKGPFMYEEMLRVPLVVSGAGIAPEGQVRNQFARSMDLLPTLCDYAGAEVPHIMDGRSLRPCIENPSEKGWAFIVSEYYAKQEWITPIRTIRTGTWKYNLYRDWGEELYNLKDDPIEMTNLADTPRFMETKRRLRRMLESEMKDSDDYFGKLKSTDRRGVPVTR